MKMLSPKEENELVGAIEQSIRLTHSGMSPNEAISKVASEKKYGPEKINRMVEAFNKSKSVHVFKSASQEDRAKPFELADSSEIIRSIYAPSQKQASSEFCLPSATLKVSENIEHPPTESINSVVDFMKSASCSGTFSEILDSSKDEMTDALSQSCRRLLKQACLEKKQVTEKIANELHMKVQFHKLAFETALEDLCEYMAPLTPRGLRKVGQYIYNGYPTTGDNLLRVIEKKARVSFPEFSKTANAVCFPTQEPYLTVSKLYSAADSMAKAEVELNIFREKKAAQGMAGNVASNALANLLTGVGVSPESISEIATSRSLKKSLEDELLESDSYNAMKGQDAKRTFILLSLYHPELKNYSHRELLDAYNSSVSTMPEIYNKPQILANSMLKNLQSSGIKDMFEIKQELDAAKVLAQTEALREELSPKKSEPPPQQTPSPMAGGYGAGRVLDSVVSGAGKVLDKATTPAKNKKDDNPRRPTLSIP